MINPAVFEFLTGFYFAILQFCFLMILAVYISSAYLTYAIITFSWMCGSVAGLWLKNLNIRGGLALGAAGYYGVYALAAQWPFSRLTLLAGSVGALLAGLWAGRFFVVMLPGFKTADRLFFHENTGFMVGIIAFFVGFTLLGRNFALWTPAILASFLLTGDRRTNGL